MLTRTRARVTEERIRTMTSRALDIALQITTLHPRLRQILSHMRRSMNAGFGVEIAEYTTMRIRRYQREISMMAMIMYGLYFLNDG
jgi:hypothetical protein